MATLQEDSTETSIVDRFSNLPNDISHHILSSLSFKDVTRVGCVSKRCRGLHLSSPSINFCDFSDVDDLSSCEVRKSLLQSFDRYLNQRGDNKLRCFRFAWGVHYAPEQDDFLDEDGICYCDEANLQLCSWIDNAVRCNVEVVELVMSQPDWFDNLPSSLFDCESLRSLVVDAKGFIGEVTSPSSNLEYMKLSNVIVKEEFWRWVSHSCKCIKKIHINSVSGSKDIIIDSTSLESFRFDVSVLDRSRFNLNISGDRLEELFIKFLGDPNNSIKISAPKLKHLDWSGNFASQHHFGELPCVQRAAISSYFGEVNHSAVFDLLHAIRRVRVLILCDSILKVFLKERFMSLQLDCVHYLYVRHLVLTDESVPAMITLLGAIPNLGVLVIKSMISSRTTFLDEDNESNCSGFDIEFWKLQNLGFVNKLKEVTLDVYHGSNILEFAKYIVEHGQNLEKMVISHVPSQHDDVMKLQSKMNSNVTSLLHQVERLSIWPVEWE